MVCMSRWDSALRGLSSPYLAMIIAIGNTYVVPWKFTPPVYLGKEEARRGEVSL
jgi:hypothetical protein